jgi:hypothetical protein
MAYASKEAKIGRFEIVTYLSSCGAIMAYAICERWPDRLREKNPPPKTVPKIFPTIFGIVMLNGTYSWKTSIFV